MKTNFETIDRNLIVNLQGEIDHHMCEVLREKIDKEYERNQAKNIVFDFDNINFMDSSGIGVIIGRAKKAEMLGGKVGIINVQPQVDKIFSLSGLYKLVGKYECLDDVLQDFE